jgi:hypothetical protein
VLFKPVSQLNSSTSGTFGVGATQLELPNNSYGSNWYKPLNPDGTQGAAVQTVNLTNGQGIILIPVAPPPGGGSLRAPEVTMLAVADPELQTVSGGEATGSPTVTTAASQVSSNDALPTRPLLGTEPAFHSAARTALSRSVAWQYWVAPIDTRSNEAPARPLLSEADSPDQTVLFGSDPIAWMGPAGHWRSDTNEVPEEMSSWVTDQGDGFSSLFTGIDLSRN